jgi:hypothetical protein
MNFWVNGFCACGAFVAALAHAGLILCWLVVLGFWNWQLGVAGCEDKNTEEGD